MVKRRVLTLSVLLLFLVALAVPASAAEGRVFDQANLFSSAQEAELQSAIDDFTSRTGFDFVVVTASNLNGKTSEAYADDFYDQRTANGSLRFGYDAEASGILYLIDMENRIQIVSTTGKMITAITDNQIEILYDQAGYPLSDGDYAGAAKNAIYCALRYATQENEEENSKEEFVYSGGTITNNDLFPGKYKSLSVLEILIALAAGLVAALLVKRGISNDYELKHSTYFYDVNSLATTNLTLSNDTFLRQEVLHHPKAPPPSSSGRGSGGSSTHMGSSGTMHGGGGSGRSF